MKNTPAAQHTPTPWKWEPAFRILRGQHGGEVGYGLPFTEEDAAFIVRAVNRDHLFEEMLNALKQVQIIVDAQSGADRLGIAVAKLIAKAEAQS